MKYDLLAAYFTSQGSFTSNCKLGPASTHCTVLSPIRHESLLQLRHTGRQLLFARQPQTSSRSGRTNVQVFVEQIRVRCCKSINSDEKHCFEFQPLDVLHAEHSNCAVLPLHPSAGARNDLDVLIRERITECLDDRMYVVLAVHKHCDGW